MGIGRKNPWKDLAQNGNLSCERMRIRKEKGTSVTAVGKGNSLFDWGGGGGGFNDFHMQADEKIYIRKANGLLVKSGEDEWNQSETKRGRQGERGVRPVGRIS